MIGLKDSFTDGSVVEELKDSSVVEELKNGSVVEKLKNGSVVEERKDGSVIKELKDSSVVEELRNGSVVDLEIEAEEEDGRFIDDPVIKTDPIEAVGDTASTETIADWGVLCCVFCCMVFTGMDFIGFGVFYPHLTDYFHTSTASVGACASVNGFVYAIVAIFSSHPIRLFGCRLPGAVGSLLYSFGLCVSSIAPNIYTIYVTYGVISGCGTALSFLTAMIIPQQRFKRNRTLANGISLLGVSIGTSIGPYLVNFLIEMYSWRGAFLLFGAVLAHRIPLCLFFITPQRFLHRSENSAKRNEITRFTVLKNVFKETFDFRLFLRVNYSLFAVAHFLLIFSISGYVQHIVNQACSIGLSLEKGVVAMSLVGTLTTVTSLPVSLLSNLKCVNRTLVYGVGMYISSMSILVLILVPGLVGTMASAVLFGIHMGVSYTLSTVVLVDIMGVAMLPRCLAIAEFIAGLSYLAAPPFIGWLFDITNDYNIAFAIIGCFGFLSGTISLALVLIIRRNQNSEKGNT